MGFASKLEDEIEQRGGELPRYDAPPTLALFGSMGADGNFPDYRSGIQFDATTIEKIEKLVASIEESRKQAKIASLRVPERGKQLGQWLKAHAKYVNLLQELIEILAPRVLKMRRGATKRSWQRRLTELKKARYIK